MGSAAQLSFHLCFWGCVKGEVCKRTLGTPDELLARIADAAACINKREDQLRRTTRGFPQASLCALRLTVGLTKVCCEL